MKRCLCLLLMVVIILFVGCSLPEQKATSGSLAEANTQEEKTQNRTNTPENKPLNNEPGSDEPAKQKAPETKQESKEKAGSQKSAITLYYQDSQGYIIPVTRSIAKQEGIAKTVLSALVDSPLNREEIEYYGVYPVLPKGTEIKGLNIKNETATVDFNGNILNYRDKIAERNIIVSIVYTLSEFKNIKSIKLLVNGIERKKLKYNTDISGVLCRENVLINTGRVNLAQNMQKYDVYLFRHENERNSYIVPVSIEMQPGGPEDLLKKLVEAFTKDWSREKLYSEIPSRTQLVRGEIRGNVLILDFSSEMRKFGGSAREDAIIKQVLYSCKQVKGVEKVKILVDGKENNLPEGTETSKELAIPNEINNIIDTQ